MGAEQAVKSLEGRQMTEERPEPRENQPEGTEPAAGAPPGASEDTPVSPGVGEEEPRGETGARRRLVRSRRERMIAGVGGGIGEYFDLDPVLVRIAIVLLAIFANGLGVLLYIAGWILMPEAPATEGDATPDDTEPAGRRGSAAPPPGDPSSTGTILLGVLLVAAGALALLWRLDVPLPGWGVVLSVLLILTGLAILFEARRGLHGGLVVLALFLTLLLGFTSTLNFGFATFGGVESGFGERNEAPVSFDDLESEYSHAFGSMNIDLSDVEFPEGTTELEIRIAFGEVTVNLPDDVGVRGDASTVFGNTETLGRESRGGVLADDSFESSGYADAERRIELDISTLFGQARVQ